MLCVILNRFIADFNFQVCCASAELIYKSFRKITDPVKKAALLEEVENFSYLNN